VAYLVKNGPTQLCEIERALCKHSSTVIVMLHRAKQKGLVVQLSSGKPSVWAAAPADVNPR
jgi:hypothetical protein